MDIYDRISQLLITKGKTRKEMCQDLKIPYSTLNSLYQRRTERIKFDMVQDIAKYLNTTVEYLALGKEYQLSPKDELVRIFEALNDSDKKQLLEFAKYLKNRQG